MDDKYLFDIPIYWCKQEPFYKTYGKKLNTFLKKFEKNSDYPLAEQLRMSLTDSFWRRYISPWRFNQIVGYVRLFKTGRQLRGELWFVSAKRMGTSMKHKHFSDIGKAFELSVYKDETSEKIFRNVLKQLKNIKKGNGKKYLLDIETFENMGRFVDWQSLMDS
ncbi:MAG: hypothetical protein C0403_03685 [Desulfobacterium sp.]|nr:hypothetical protein [Desulfobacterium sp.]